MSLAALHADEILSADDLPLRYAGFSTCFRREAGAAGKDTRGIFRVHQFDKVEMFSFVEPSASGEEHERLLAIEEEILQELEIPYRVVNVAAGDLGASAAKKYDCEAWLPGQQRYRELTSTSNTTDYQARRLRARFRPRRGRLAAARPHGERHRGRRGPHPAGDHGEPSDRRRRISSARACCKISAHPSRCPAPRRRTEESGQMKPPAAAGVFALCHRGRCDESVKKGSTPPESLSRM